MRRVVAVLGVVVLCASVVMSAEGGGISPVPTGPLEVIRPDLVVKQVEVSRGGAVEFPTYTFRITVANVGTANAAATKTGLIAYVLTRIDQPMQAYMMGEVNTPPINAGSQAVVTFSTDRIYAKMFIFVTADFPTTANQLGAISERSEGNNCLIVPLNTQATFPRVYR